MTFVLRTGSFTDLLSPVVSANWQHISLCTQAPGASVEVFHFTVAKKSSVNFRYAFCFQSKTSVTRDTTECEMAQVLFCCPISSFHILSMSCPLPFSYENKDSEAAGAQARVKDLEAQLNSKGAMLATAQSEKRGLEVTLADLREKLHEVEHCCSLNYFEFL